jgi:hypothetical protein
MGQGDPQKGRAQKLHFAGSVAKSAFGPDY